MDVNSECIILASLGHLVDFYKRMLGDDLLRYN